MSNYDAWLEKPYQDRYAQDAVIEQYEDQYREYAGLDEDAEVDPDDVLEYVEGLAEDAAIERAEAAREDDWLMDYYDDRY